MLLRTEPDGGVLAVAQPAHAALAGRLALAWDDDLRPDLVVATSHHDDVWAGWDATPRWNPETGLPLTFLELEAAERVAVWARAPEVAAPFGPAAELWVLRHALRLHAGSDDAAVKGMAAALGARADALVEELRAAHAPRFDDVELARGTSLLALWDTLALALCFGVDEPQSAGVLMLAPGADAVDASAVAVAVAPWPFLERRVDTFVEARRLPGVLAGQAELDAAWALAEPFDLPVALVSPS